MSNFWKTPEGKILSHTIHEHSHGLSHIINSIRLIERLVEKGKITFSDKETEDMLLRSLKSMEDGKIKCKESVDYCYNKFKEKQEEL
jgi:hypothetical protein